jgi:general secretion pathway protein A
MNNKLLALYGLKWSPFSPQVPTEALYVSPRVESFCWRSSSSPAREDLVW